MKLYLISISFLSTFIDISSSITFSMLFRTAPSLAIRKRCIAIAESENVAVKGVTKVFEYMILPETFVLRVYSAVAVTLRSKPNNGCSRFFNVTSSKYLPPSTVLDKSKASFHDFSRANLKSALATSDTQRGFVSLPPLTLLIDIPFLV